MFKYFMELLSLQELKPKWTKLKSKKACLEPHLIYEKSWKLRLRSVLEKKNKRHIQFLKESILAH